MKTKITIAVIFVLVAAGFGYVYFLNVKTPPLSQSTEAKPESTAVITPSPTPEKAPAPSVYYSCEKGKTIEASFRDNGVALKLGDGRTLDLPKISESDEDGVKFANSGDKIAFWVKDDSSFLQENKVSTFAACRIEP